jgi:hypothetical protein
MAISDTAILDWVERIAQHFAQQDRLPLIAGRIVGWLMICDPPEQSAEDIAAAIGASRASLSTNLRLLGSVGLVRGRTRPGRRTRYFRIDDDIWEAVVRAQVASLGAFTEVTNDGLALIGPASARGSRLRAARDVFAWMQNIFDKAPRISAARRRREP